MTETHSSLATATITDDNTTVALSPSPPLSRTPTGEAAARRTTSSEERTETR